VHDVVAVRRTARPAEGHRLRARPADLVDMPPPDGGGGSASRTSPWASQVGGGGTAIGPPAGCGHRRVALRRCSRGAEGSL